MARPRRSVVCAVLTAAMLLFGPLASAATPGQCHVLDVDFQPAKRSDLPPGKNPPPQIVVWLEDTSGTYLDTIFITKQTGTNGLGNRPGRFDFNSGPLWPYGKRITTFPVWAHRKTPRDYDAVVFQDNNENNLSHSFQQSSRDQHYCRPMQPLEPSWDMLTCASPNTTYTDKGVLSPTAPRSLYPPRQDVQPAPGMDSDSVATYGALNTFDAVSQATPLPDMLAQVSWPIPDDLAMGSYVMWVEVSKEFDHNATYSTTAYPAPQVQWSEYGEPYRGQPSVIYKVPFTIGDMASTATTSTYEGYGDPDGQDGLINPPDSTITTNVPGSGASRFALITQGADSFRVRVVSRPEFDSVPPGLAQQMAVATSTSSTASIRFLAPGEDGAIGKVKGYEVRYRVGRGLTEATFDDPASIDPKLSIEVAEPGSEQSFALDRLLPLTEYSVAIRAFDDCHNTGAVTVLTFTTPDRAVGEVDACFIATAAYGSVMAADVQMLRHVRDSLLRKSVLGELAIETYYTFGPAVAGVVGESELLRATARDALAPIVRYVRAFSF